jgi:hypothetical protein
LSAAHEPRSHAELRTDLDDLVEGHAVTRFVTNGVAIEIGKDGLRYPADGCLKPATKDKAK